MPQEITHLVIGRVAAARGVVGELKVTIETDDPERFYDLECVYLGDELEPFDVERVRLFKGQALLKLAGLDDRDQAEDWIGAFVQVDVSDALPLAQDEYYYHQIEGLRVQTVEGEALGAITMVMATGANDVYVINGPAGEILIPALKGVVHEIDLEAGTMIVRLPEGLR